MFYDFFKKLFGKKDSSSTIVYEESFPVNTTPLTNVNLDQPAVKKRSNKPRTQKKKDVEKSLDTVWPFEEPKTASKSKTKKKAEKPITAVASAITPKKKKEKSVAKDNIAPKKKQAKPKKNV